MTKNNIESILNAYKQRFPAEADRTALFAGYLASTTTDGLYNRRNFNGHITTSAFIFNNATRELLLIRHKALDRWLQPGGHVEQDATLVGSALREAAEETGIAGTCLQYAPVAIDPETPFDIDSHYIPANQRKGEEGHYHHDLRYLFLYTGAGVTRFDPDETTGLKWVELSELASDATFGGMAQKIKDFMAAAV